MSGLYSLKIEPQELYYRDIHCIQSFFSLFDLVGHFVSFIQRASVNTIDMDKNIFPTIIWCDKSITFRVVEKFYCTVIHYKKI